jgi:TetR/AcrR family transcriptional regulator
MGSPGSDRTFGSVEAGGPVEEPNSREKILEVAEALFARRGFSGVGMREVADAAGLGKSSLFHHFRSKAQLYLAALARALGRIEERFEPVLSVPGGPLERLDRSIDALVDVLVEHPATARLLLRALIEDEEFPEDSVAEQEAVDRALQGILEGIRRLLREGIEFGALRDASVAHTVQTLIGATVYHFASGEFGEDLLGHPLFSAEAVSRRKNEVKALLHHGLGVQGPTR